MSNIIIFGTNAFSKLMKWYIENDTDNKVIGFTLNSEYVKEKSFCECPIYEFENLDKLFPEKNFEILLTVGYSQMNGVREKLFNDCKNSGYKIGSFIHSSVTLFSKNIGEGNILLENVRVQPFSKIGDGNIIQHFTIVSHEAKVGNFNYFAGNAHVAGISQVGNRCFVGINAIIQNGVKLASYNLVGAGACVSKNTEEYMITAPNKMRCFKASIRAMDLFLR